LLHCKIKHLKFDIAATEQVHRFLARMWILPCALQLRQGLAKTPGIKKVFTQLESKLKVGRIPRHALSRIVDEDFCPPGFGGLQLLGLFRMQFICGIVR
jgi:hypothetical protein